MSSFKFLGLILDENMTWKSHTDNIANKISRTTGLLNKLKHYLPSSILETLYKSLILCHLNFSILAWGFQHSRLSKLQKKAIRTITNSKYNAHTEPLFKKLNLLKLEDIFKRRTLQFYFKHKNNSFPVYLQSIQFSQASEIHHHNTRNRNRLYPSLVNRKFAENCIRNYVAKLVNETDECILDKISTHSYKGFSDYVKHCYILQYKLECTILNCYICNNNNR